MLAELPASVPKLMYSNGLPSDSAHGAGLPSRRVGCGDSRTRNGGGPRCAGSAPSSEAGKPEKPCAARSAKPSSGLSPVSRRISSMGSAANAMSPISAVPQCGATRACGSPASSATMAAANSADSRTTKSGRHSWIDCRRAGSAARGLRSATTFFTNLTTNSSAGSPCHGAVTALTSSSAGAAKGACASPRPFSVGPAPSGVATHTE